MVEPLDPDAVRITPGFLRSELSRWGPDGHAITSRHAKPQYYWGIPTTTTRARPVPGAPAQPNFALTVTAQEAEDDLKRIQAAIRRDADLMRSNGKGGGKRRKTKATPERASPCSNGFGEGGVEGTAAGSPSPGDARSPADEDNTAEFVVAARGHAHVFARRAPVELVEDLGRRLVPRHLYSRQHTQPPTRWFSF